LFVKLLSGKSNMLKRIVIYLARKKNSSFTLDQNVTNEILLSFLMDKIVAIVRGLKLILFVKKKNLIFLGKNVRVIGKKQFYYGKHVQIGNNVQINSYGTQGLFLDDNVWIGSNSFLKVSFSFTELGECIRLGKNVGIGEFAHLGGAGGLTIESDCIIGPYFSCHPENHSFVDTSKLIRQQDTSRKGISIGKNCWIGAKVTILDGVTIGSNCVIAAGAVVTKDMPSNAVIGGVPAKVMRSREAVEKLNIEMKRTG